MSDNLADAQAKLIEALLDDRIPEGFDAKGVRATARVLRGKQRQLAKTRQRGGDSHAPVPGVGAVLRALRRLLAWWTGV